MEKRLCQNCKLEFIIEPEDFDFYEKLGVVAPSMCSVCRARHRLAFRNERVLYKRACEKCKKDVISVYSPNKPYRIWCYDCWFADDWDADEFGREYDLSRPFFEQFEEVWRRVPKIALIYVRAINSDYINISADVKNCYMIIESSNNEDCIHSYWIQQCRDSVDLSFAGQTELSYESDDCYNSYRLFYSKGCHDCRDSYFLHDCRGASNCIASTNLRNQQYCVFNEPVGKEAYEKFLADARLDTYTGVEALRKKFSEFLLTQPRKYAEIVNAPNSTGNYVKNAKNCKEVFHCYDAEDSKYCVHVWRDAKDCMDVDTSGRGTQLIYNSINCAIDTSHCVSSIVCWTCSFMDYCILCFNSNNCFGCTGMRKKDYHILNKAYSKEDYKKLRDAIVAEMKSKGEYGNFFPASVSAFGYNETPAQEQFSLTKEEATRLGFSWEEYPRGTYGRETKKWEDMPSSILETKIPDITKEIFACIGCKKNYRVIPAEFQFYKRLLIPLPRLCPDCRHARRFVARGPNRLFEEQQCRCDYKVCKNSAIHEHHPEGRCQNKFRSSYPVSTSEILYCESCYQKEVA